MKELILRLQNHLCGHKKENDNAMMMFDTLKHKINKAFRESINDLYFIILSQKDADCDKSPQFLEWVGTDWVSSVEAFVAENNLLQSDFALSLKKTFDSDRIDLLIKRWIVDYYFSLFSFLDEKLHASSPRVLLCDTALNRHAAKLFEAYFKRVPKIEWKQPSAFLKRLAGICFQCANLLYVSFKTGVIFFKKRKRFLVMREALWGLSGCGGHYFHDDFFVDGKMIKKDDLLLFSRGIPEESRLKARTEALDSRYSHFDLNRIPVSFGVFFLRIIPKYAVKGIGALVSSVRSPHFVLFSNIFEYFTRFALPYEKVFSNFEIGSELGHNYFSANHIAESIICQNYGTKYYLMHYTDNARKMYRHLTAYVSCDKFLIWGPAHIQNNDEKKTPYASTGYVFKKFIGEIKKNRTAILKELGVDKNGEVVSFFDETFGGICKMTQEHFVNFWKLICAVAENRKHYTILIKAKESDAYKKLKKEFLEEYLGIRRRLNDMDNVFFIDAAKWSFIETIGVSDIAVTQGIASSATIAIICGIEGFYFDQAGYEHPLKQQFKDKIIFDDAQKLQRAIEAVFETRNLPSREIPPQTLRGLDAFDDERGIELFRSFLADRPVCQGVNT